MQIAKNAKNVKNAKNILKNCKKNIKIAKNKKIAN